MDSRVIKTTDPDPETEGEEGEVTQIQYFTNMDLINVYDYTGGGNVVANGVAAAALGVGSFKLIDERDQHPYLVRRHADGNCWMVENLALELSTSGTLTPEDSDVSEDWNPYESSGGANNFATYSLAQLGTEQQYQYQPYGTSGSTYHWATKYYNDPETGEKTLGTVMRNNIYSQIPRSYNNKSTYLGGISLTGVSYSANYSTGDTDWNADHAPTYYGHQYNWYSATAESGTFAMSSGNARDSICPFGWELPRRNGEKSWASMITSYKDPSGNTLARNKASTSAVRQIPISLVGAGRYDYSTGNPRTSHNDHGYYIQSIAQSGTDKSMFHFDATTDLSLYSNSQKIEGASIRCVNHGTETHTVQPTQEDPIITCSPNSICYDANGGSGNAMANTGSATFGSSKVLSAPTYTRTGYAFVGWSESKDAVQSGAYIYGPNETITVPNLSSEGMTLYAQWLAPENSSYTMQAFGRNETVKTCANMTDGNNGTTEERIALRDERDDNVYIVTKLKDGNCWMTSNLALNLADFAGKTPSDNVPLLTTENTDLTASRTDLLPVSNGDGNGGQKYYDPGKTMYDYALNLTCGAAPAQEASEEDKAAYNTCKATVTPGVDGNYFSIASASLLGTTQSVQFQSGNQRGYDWHWGSKLNESGELLDGNNLGSDGKPINKTSPYVVKDGIDIWIEENSRSAIPRSFAREVGAYNWYAATAGSGTYSMVTTTTEDSICPSGWRLTVAGDWSNLFSASGLINNDDITLHSREKPISIASEVYYSAINGLALDGGGTSRFWNARSTAHEQASRFYLTDSVVGLGYTANKSDGYNVRCIKR